MNQEDLTVARRIVSQHSEQLFKYPNVFGVGVGMRTVAGRKTEELCIVVLVSRKVPAGSLRPEELIPRELRGESGTIATDVVERAMPVLTDDKAKYSPLVGGCCISAEGGSGTLGAIMYDRRDASVVGLTCNHALTIMGQRGAIPVRNSVWQAVSGDNYIGDTTRIVPWMPAALGAAANLEAPVDAGIVGIRSGIATKFRCIGLGNQPYVPLPPFPGLAVSKRGFVSGLTSGTVQEVGLEIVLTDRNGQTLLLGRGLGSVFSIAGDNASAFSVEGDSGSLIADSDGAASRGILFGGEEAPGLNAYGCELGMIMQQLELETPCTGAMNALFRGVLRSRFLMMGIHSVERITEYTEITRAFRSKYLEAGRAGSVGKALEDVFQGLAIELSEDLYMDEGFSELMGLAIGDWLVQPTLNDKLDYRLPADFGVKFARAFDRFHELHPKATGFEWIASAFKETGGKRMQDVLVEPAQRIDVRRGGRAS